MQKEKNISTQEVISMEEYLNKRQKIREQEKKTILVADSAKRKALPG